MKTIKNFKRGFVFMAGLIPLLEDLLGIKYPVLLGGMAGITGPGLASAVSEAGGLGTIAGATETGSSLSEQIKRMRSLTGKPFAVNIPLLMSRSVELVDTVIKEKVKIVITAAGTPEKFTGSLKSAGITVIHVVPSPQSALAAEEAGVDAVIAEGFESGGAASIFEIGTLALVPQVVDAVKIPVIAAGGIADARGYLAARILGAAGVSLGTAFLASRECRRVGKELKEQLLKAGASDTAIAARGLHGFRALKNKAYHEIEKMVLEGAGRETLLNIIFSSDYTNPENFLSCGQGVGLVREIKSVREIIEGMVKGAETILKN